MAEIVLPLKVYRAGPCKACGRKWMFETAIKEDEWTARCVCGAGLKKEAVREKKMFLNVSNLDVTE